MRLIIHLNGSSFTSKENNEVTALEFKDLVYKNIDEMNRMEVETDKGFIVLGVTALQGAVLEFLE